MRLSHGMGCLLLGLLLAAPALAQNVQQVAVATATVGVLYGDVRVREGGGDWYPAKVGQRLTPGDALKTGTRSRAQLNIGGGSCVRLEQRSQVEIVRPKGGAVTAVKVLVGGIWVSLSRALGGKGGMEVHMPGVVAATRSTVFRCEVADDGTNSTTVYEGKVGVQSGVEELLVTPAMMAKIALGQAPALSSIDLDQDESQDWVIYNLQRDVLNELGNPTVLVALTEKTPAGWVQAAAATRSVADDLQRRGFVVSTLDLTAPGVQTDDEGRVQGIAADAADYLVLGSVATQDEAGAQAAVRNVTAKVGLYKPADDRQLLETQVSIKLEVPADMAADRVAGMIARTFAPLLGEDLGPRMVRELMIDRPGVVRIDMSNVKNRQQVEFVRGIAASLDGVERASPLPVYGGRYSLAVAGAPDADQLAAALTAQGGDMLQNVTATRRVVAVRFKDPAQ